MIKKAIILAGGTGSRLYPMTQIVTKQLLPVHDKPMIFYPISIIMMMGIRDILIIIKPEDQHLFEKLLGDGSQWGINIQYKVQLAPRGLPEAFIIGREFIGDEPVLMMLGDNIMYGSGLISFLQGRITDFDGASVMAFNVKDPERFGIVEFNPDGSVKSLAEKPKKPLSDWAIAGIYIFPPDVVERSSQLVPSERGEIEIIDLIRSYDDDGLLKAYKAPRGFFWLDTGTPTAIGKASQYVAIVEDRHNQKIACLEEIAFCQNYITMEQLKALATDMGKNEYSDYLWDIIKFYDEESV